MGTPSEKTVDVLIGSSRSSFWETVTVVLKGYYPYQLKHVQSIDALSEAGEGFKPVLAIIDGQDGTQATNEWVQTAKMSYDCPVIVLHSAAAPLDFNVVKKNGANEVMHINFDREFISDMILQLAPIELTGEDIPITSLMPVDLRDIEAGMQINFDVYAHLPANQRSVLMRKSGDSINERQVEKFNSLKQQMYVKKTQMKEFFEYARTVSSMRNSEFPISMTEKFQRSKKAIYEIMTQFLNGASTDFAEGKVIFEKLKSIIADFELTKDLSAEELSTEIYRFTGNLRTNYHDCICVSAYAAFFAQALGWDAGKRETAALAGLLHNIGLSQLPPEAADKSAQAMTPEELRSYHFYPERSVNLVKAKKVPLPNDVSTAVAEHREKGSGTGFPKKLPMSDMSDMGKLLAFSYHFHELTALSSGKTSMTPANALAHIRENAISGAGEYDMVITTTIFKKLKF
jgi:HD-GYP domain